MVTSCLARVRATGRRTLVSSEASDLLALGVGVAKAVIWGQRQRALMRTSALQTSEEHTRSNAPADPTCGKNRMCVEAVAIRSNLQASI